MIRIITIERESGSGAAAVAERVAKRLSWQLWDQLLTDEIARRMGCPCKTVTEHEERRDPAYYRLFKAFLKGSFEGTTNVQRMKMVDTDTVCAVTRQIQTEIAEAGNAVIVGRGSAYHLADRPDAFHVFIYAPFDEKVRRLQATGKSEKEASELAETVDVDRADFIKRYYAVEWPERHYFHLMINSTVGEEVVVDIILDAVARFSKQRAA